VAAPPLNGYTVTPIGMAYTRGSPRPAILFCVPSKRVTITLPEDLAPRVQELADDAHLALATYVTRVVEHHVLNQEGLTAMEYWESRYNPMRPAELAKADEAIEAARARLRPPQQGSAQQ
jgi:hypothetical protein